MSWANTFQAEERAVKAFKVGACLACLKSSRGNSVAGAERIMSDEPSYYVGGNLETIAGFGAEKQHDVVYVFD